MWDCILWPSRFCDTLYCDTVFVNTLLFFGTPCTLGHPVFSDTLCFGTPCIAWHCIRQHPIVWDTLFFWDTLHFGTPCVLGHPVFWDTLCRRTLYFVSNCLLTFLTTFKFRFKMKFCSSVLTESFKIGTYFVCLCHYGIFVSIWHKEPEDF